jgi:hypothetical protein
MASRVDERKGTQFLNVDLDVFSGLPLDALATALGDQVFVLYVGKWGRLHSAHFELAGYTRNPHADRLIGRFVQLIRRLPRQARRLWDTAEIREFNIGIEAAQKAPAFELRLQPETLAAVASIRGRIVVTVYPPDRVTQSSRRASGQARAPRRKNQ